jgi:hypothetical protein
MNIMMPMGLNSTHFLSYREISTENIDLFDDAWGFYQEFKTVFDLLGHLNPEPDKRLTRRLIKRIRKNY